MKWFLVMLASLTLTGCSSFHKEWRAAVKQPIPTNSIEGPWSGSWHSDQNGHHGALQCVVTKTSDTTYRAHYCATYKRILHFSYVATLNGHETNGTIALKGEADLGKLAGGVYTYEANATSTEFHSSYANKYDHGAYDMNRPSAATAPK